MENSREVYKCLNYPAEWSHHFKCKFNKSSAKLEKHSLLASRKESDLRNQRSNMDSYKNLEIKLNIDGFSLEKITSDFYASKLEYLLHDHPPLC